MEPQEGTVAEVAEVVQPTFVDPVAAELAAVRAEIAVEEGTPTGEAKPTEPVAAPAVTAPATVQAEPKPEDHKGNATAAIIAERRKRQAAEAQALILQGQVQAMTAMMQPAREQAEPEVVVTPLQEVRSEMIALAEKFDQGEISAKDMEAQRQALADREWEIRSTSLQQTQAAPATDLHLETATAQLEKDYPVLNILTAEDLAPLATLAKRQAEISGKPIQPGAMGTLELRTRIAQLATQMYGGPSTASTPQPALSEEAQARERKMAFAAGMPPDVTKMGSPASDTLTNESDALARMEGMTEEQQWALLKTLPVSARTTLGLRR